MGIRQAVQCLSWVKKDLLRRFPEVRGDFLDDEIDRIIAQMRKRLKKERRHGMKPTTEKSSAVGNTASMREALELMNDLFDKGVICTSYANTAEEMEQIEELYQKAKSALDKPLGETNKKGG